MTENYVVAYAAAPTVTVHVVFNSFLIGLIIIKPQTFILIFLFSPSKNKFSSGNILTNVCLLSFQAAVRLIYFLLSSKFTDDKRKNMWYDIREVLIEQK